MNIIVETERLILREFTEKDVDNLFALDSQPEILRWGNGGNPTNYETIKNQSLPKMIKYYEKYEHYGIWAAIEKQTNEFIGWFHFYPATESRFGVELKIVTDEEIALGYRLHPHKWGKGYATEGSQILVFKGFKEWDVQKVVSWTLLDNQRSIKVMKKVGLQYEKEFSFTESQLPNLTASERKAVKYALHKV
ncbi:GNAT family N-acetyltransferase [Iningainema tapete]|uniref:GNAT family N-acetyltransferase n=1 Tax=Iningainema tapete BLCC-T55 TaxID=2748662 RepID=A0A8J6XQN3_9CYAN|nr:GNAT family N-acetyltransferase [Iningainema tapete]MBD2776485.1 GNAT family N-acetyltransferase [Iningainema tapete BLCC-T55]